VKIRNFRSNLNKIGYVVLLTPGGYGGQVEVSGQVCDVQAKGIQQDTAKARREIGRH